MQSSGDDVPGAFTARWCGLSSIGAQNVTVNGLNRIISGPLRGISTKSHMLAHILEASAFSQLAPTPTLDLSQLFFSAQLNFHAYWSFMQLFYYSLSSSIIITTWVHSLVLNKNILPHQWLFLKPPPQSISRYSRADGVPSSEVFQQAEPWNNVSV